MSKNVFANGREVSAYYKTSSGNEPTTPALNKGILSHQIKGKTYFTSWSFDVKFERKNVLRHMDMTSHNCK